VTGRSARSAVLAGAAGGGHLRGQVSADWWLLAPIVVGFGTQVALTAEYRGGGP
jgi:hypothetical protein